MPRYLRRPEGLPLLGKVTNNCLDEIEATLDQGKRGKLFYIEGDGGTGKSEILRFVQTYFDKLDLGEDNLTRGPIPIFGGIIDLYDYRTYSGAGIEQALIDNWRDFKVNHPQLDHLTDLDRCFQEYNSAYEKLRLFRFAMPNVQGNGTFMSGRQQSLNREFLNGLTNLCNDYLPVICLDTAELLEDESEIEERSTVADVVNWLSRLLQSSSAKNCLIIIAGRPSGDKTQDSSKPVLLPDRDNTPLETRRWLERQWTEYSQNGTFHPYHPERLNEQEIKAYIHWYYLVKNNKNNSQDQMDKGGLESYIEQIQPEWPEIVADLVKIGALHPNLKNRAQKVYEAIHILTQGKPLLVDWFCQMAYEIGDANLLGIDDDGNASQSDFFSGIGKLISGEDYTLFKGEHSKESNRVLRFACIARKGLSAEIVKILSEEEANQGPEKALSLETAQLILDKFRDNPFIKVRERPFDQAIFLHDEIYTNLIEIVYNFLGKAYVQQKADILARQYAANSDYSASVRRRVQNIRNLQQPELYINEQGQPAIRPWFERKLTDPLNKTEEEIGVLYFLRQESQIQNYLVERLHYRLTNNPEKGYDEYCVVATMAIFEQATSFDTRLKREFLRFRRQSEQAFNKPYHIIEAQLRSLKRNLRSYPGEAKEFVNQLRVIAAETEELTVEAERKVADETEVKAVAEAGIVRDRLLLCQADALVTIYDQGLPIDPAKAYEELSLAVKLAQQVKRVQVNYNPGDVRDFIFWQKHVIIGRANHSLGRLCQSRECWNLEQSISHYRAAIDNYKRAENRMNVYLNDTRGNLAYVLNLHGQREMAIEICNTALEEQIKAGHRVYIALALNIMAQILAGSDRTLLDAYNVSQQAIEFMHKDLDKKEYTALPQYQLLNLYNAEISRKLARLYADSYDASRELHLQAHNLLEELYKYYTKQGYEDRQIDTLNMQGDTQRSLGSFKEIHRVHALRSGNLSEAMELAAKRDSAFVEAESFYKKSLELCQPAVQAWYDREYWYSYVDNLLSLSNLAVHRWYTGSTPTVSQDEVAQSFRQLEEALEQLHQKTVQPNTTPLSQYQQAMLRGKELGYQLLMGKYYDRLATWNWLCYLQLQYTQQEQVKRDQLLHEYMVNLIKSLNCYIHFQPDTLNTSEYSHGLPNIGWLEARIDTNLKGNNERNMALQVARELENNPDLANGWRLFTYMASLRDQLNLSYI